MNIWPFSTIERLRFALSAEQQRSDFLLNNSNYSNKQWAHWEKLARERESEIINLKNQLIKSDTALKAAEAALAARTAGKKLKAPARASGAARSTTVGQAIATARAAGTQAKAKTGVPKTKAKAPARV